MSQGSDQGVHRARTVAERCIVRSMFDGYQPAMLAFGGISVTAALITGLFVSDDRVAAPRLAPLAPHHGCALPVPDLEKS